MAIATLDALLAALPAGQNLLLNKGTVANVTAGAPTSLWRAAGVPAQAAIPGVAATCNNSTLGGMAFSNPGTGLTSYLAKANLASGGIGTEIQFHDRLAHMGGLSGIVTTAQAVGVDVSVSTDNMADRRGRSNYSDVQWFLEWYTDTGATAASAIVSYTAYDGSAGGAPGRSVIVSLAASTRAARYIPIIGTNNEPIMSVQSVTLSSSTGTAGSFGVTASRLLGSVATGLSNAGVTFDWPQIGFPRVPDSACISLVLICNSSASGYLAGVVKLIQG